MAGMKRKSQSATLKRSASRAKARRHRPASTSLPAAASVGTPPGLRPPSSFARRVLLACTGLSPQIVTETLYALAVKANEPFVPTEVVLLTTKEGRERARLSLLSADPGWFHRMLADYRLPPIAFDDSRIRVLTDAQGRELEDIRSKEDNEQVADFILETVRELTADPNCALHASIAGGRKTMGFYLGYALSLYGRPQDRLSHVLVSEPYESSWDFFYPTPYERIIQTRNDKLANCKDAEVTLADIPFVRLREGLPPRLHTGMARLSEVVAAANRALLPPRLIIDLKAQRVWADEIALDLSPTALVVLLWLAEHAKREDPVVNWTTPEAADEFLAIAKRVFDPMGCAYEQIEEALDWRRGASIKLGRYFEPHKSRINRAFEEALGPTAARRYQIPPRGANALPLAPDQIEIKD